MEIHYVDWLVWIIISIVYFRISHPKDDPVEGLSVVIIWAIASIVYAGIFYYLNWSDIYINFIESLNLKP